MAKINGLKIFNKFSFAKGTFCENFWPQKQKSGVFVQALTIKFYLCFIKLISLQARFIPFCCTWRPWVLKCGVREQVSWFFHKKTGRRLKTGSHHGRQGAGFPEI
ncbi:MAG: hypothetical protein WA081_20385 [Desulfosalsimonadaceae bacterium]